MAFPRSHHFVPGYVGIDHSSRKEFIMHDDKSEVASIIETATAAATPAAVTIDGHPVAWQHVLPAGYETQVTDLEPYAPNPRRVRGTVNPATADALIAYLTRFGDERTTIWVHPTSGRIEAVLDDHHPRIQSTQQTDDAIIQTHVAEIAGHGDHRAVLELQHPPEWVEWLNHDGVSFDQTDFAEFIEANAKEIREPAAADVLELAQSFHAVSSATFRSAKRLKDGQTQFQYDESITATAGQSGDMTVPNELKLAISPFVGEIPYEVTARFRYRVGNGKLSLSFKLDRPDEIVRHALLVVQGRIGLAFENVYIGTPRSN